MHPLAKIMNQFRNVFSLQYYCLLNKNKKIQLKVGEGVFDHKMSKQKMMQNNADILRMEIKGFIKTIVDQVLRFYDIELKKRDVKRDLFENVITGLVLRDEIYTIMFRLYSKIEEDNI